MGLRKIAPQGVTERAVRALHLDQDALDLFSAEALAASIRRAASFLCPTTPSDLIRAVDDAIARLPGAPEDLRGHLEALLGAVVAYGDLLELQLDTDVRNRRHLYLGPPSFVQRASGACLLSGVRPDGAPLLSDDLMPAVAHDGHVRVLTLGRDESAIDVLTNHGLLPIAMEQWLHEPRPATARELIEFYDVRLSAAGSAGEIESPRVLDPTTKPTYYSGRWRSLKRSDTGRFVARRPQAFGAELWCYMEVKDGEPVRLIDLPVESPLARGADEAWRLQAAIDSIAGRPQTVRISQSAQHERSVLDFFSPLPSWAQRRLDILGTPLLRSKGALMSYALPSDELTEEFAALSESMWIIPIMNEGAVDAQ